MHNIKSIAEKIQKYRKEYKALEEEQLETQGYKKINEIEIDPDNPELQKSIHNL